MPHMDRQRKQSIFAAACAVVAVLAVFAYTTTVSSAAQVERKAAIEEYGGQTTQVLVAIKDIGAGTALDETNTSSLLWLVDLLPATDVAKKLDEVKGQVASTDIHKNEPILLSRTGNGSTRIDVPSSLEAVTISTDNVLAVGGAISTGSFVDVYVESNSGKISLLGNKILVIETSSSNEESSNADLSWVTLAVSPESVSELISAAAKGSIHLTLPGK